MKFLIKHLYIYILFSIIFPLECYEQWFDSNIKTDNMYYEINANINKTEPIKIYSKNNEKYRMEILDKIVICDSIKTVSYNKKNNQLYIEKSDKNLSDFIFSFLDINNFINKVKKNNNRHIKLKKTPYGNVHLYFNNKCNFIDSIVVNRMKNKFIINDVSITPIKNIDSLFVLEINEDEVFKYDLR